jgi:2-keto-4-pentenoate hydratase
VGAHVPPNGVNTAQIVAQLDRAERLRAAIPPLSQTHSGLTPEHAYHIQAAWLATKLARDEKLVGRKIGLTSRAMQEQFGVHEPDFGFLLASMLRPSGSIVHREDLLQPRVEPEIAFWLNQQLRGPGVTLEQVLAATDGVSAALEVVDSRIEAWRIKLIDTIADNGSSARAVVSDRRMPCDRLDLVAESVNLRRNGQQVGRGSGGAVLGHPAQAIAWLANRLAEFDEVLEPGQVILPGGMCASVLVEANDTFEAEFSQLGTVSVTFR